MSNYIHYKVFDEITYPFPNFNGATVESFVFMQISPRWTSNLWSLEMQSLIPRSICWWSVEKSMWRRRTAYNNNERDYCIFQGGLISLHAVLERPDVFRGVVLIAPGLVLEVSSFRVSNLTAFKRNSCSSSSPTVFSLATYYFFSQTLNYIVLSLISFDSPQPCDSL